MVFISRKAFEAAVQTEVSKAMDQFYQNQRQNEMEREFHRRIDELERRIRKLEGKPEDDNEYIPVQGIR